MSIITTELLDALLNPIAAAPGQQSPRAQAEAHLKSLPLVDRAHGFLQVICSPQPKEGHLLLSCVLLRRDISNLAGDVLIKKLSAEESILVLRDMVQPLLGVLVDDSAKTTNSRHLVGHCLAEVCLSLSLIAPSDSDAAIQVMLSKIATNCAQADTLSLRFLANLCDCAPLPLYRSGAFENLVSLLSTASGAIASSDSLQAFTEAVCGAGIALQVATTRPGTAIPTISLLQTTDDLVIDPSSPVVPLSKSCLMPLLQRLGTLKSTDASSSDSLGRCMQQLVHVAGTCPSLLAGDLQVLSSLVQTCLCIASNAELEKDCRLSALEVLSSISQVEDVKRRILNTPQGMPIRTMLLQGSDQYKGVVQLCAEFIVVGVDDDVAEWAVEPASLLDDAAAYEQDDVANYAETLLQTFLHNLGGGATSLPVVLPMVESLLGNTEWSHQRAALSILEQCLYAAPVSFSQHVPVALEAALSLSERESVRIQFQALTLLGSLCEFGPATLREQHGARMLQAIARGASSCCSKVASAACMSLVSYCRGGRDAKNASFEASTVVVPYLQDLLMSLVSGPLSLEVTKGGVVDSGALTVQVRAIGAVACLAEASGDAFAPFYGNVMPGLVACAQIQSNNYEISQLVGAAIEAMTIVGQAIGESHCDLYAPDAEKVMQIALPLLQAAAQQQDVSNIPMDQLLSACARVASVMGEKYTPYVEVVLPHLLNRLSEKADVEYSEGNEAGLEATKRGDLEMDEDQGTESMTVALPGKGLTKVTINVTKMQEKSQAARAIYEHADALGAAFGPYIQTTLQVLVPLIAFQYSGEVRSTCAQAAAAVFNCACLNEEFTPLAQDSLPMLAEAICKQTYSEDTSDMEVVFALADSLSDTLYFAYRNLTPEDRSIVAKFSPDLGTETTKLLMNLMASCLERRSKIVRTLEGQDGVISGEDEQNELIIALQSEQEVLTPLVDSVGYTLKFLRENFLSIFDSFVAPVLGPHLKSGSDSRALFAALCLFDDCVEHCGSVAAKKYSSQLAKGALRGMEDRMNCDDSSVKQVALYGVAQIARHGPPESLSPHVQELVPALQAIASTPKDQADNLFVVENAVSALASLVLIGRAPFADLKFINCDNIISTFLKQLPLREDEDEAKICHSGFCDLIEAGQVQPTSETLSILRVIGETLVFMDDGEELADATTLSRFAEVLLNMQNKVPGDRMQQAFQALSEEAQQAINGIMEQYTRSNVVTP